MGKPNKDNKTKKPKAQFKTEKPGRKDKSKFREDNSSEEKILLVNIPKKKQGKFSKDFKARTDKLLEELDLLPDSSGRINFNQKRKKESLDNYKPSFNPGRFNQIISQEKSEEKFTFSQNYLKKPKSNSKQELVKLVEKKKKKEILFNQEDQEIDQDMDQFVKIMKEAQLRKSQKRFKTDILEKGRAQYPRFEQHKKQDKEGWQEKRKEKEHTFEPFEEHWTFESVQKGIQEEKLYQGIFIINEKNPANSFIKCSNFEEKVFFEDSIYRNRALHNAVVVFQVTKGKPTRVKERTENLTPYEMEEIEIEAKINSYPNGVEEHIQPPQEKNEGAFTTTEGEENVSESEEEKSSSNDNSEISEEDEEDIDEEEDDGESEEEESEEDEEIIDEIIDEEERKFYGFEKQDLTSSIDESISDEDEEKRKKKHKKTDNKKNKESNNVKQAGKIQERRNPKVYGKIVYILDNPEFARKFVCTLKKPLNSQNRFILACPIEKKLPMILVTSSFQEISTESQKYYLAEFLYWSKNSKYPHGHILEEIGDMGLINIESDALLKNYNVYNEEFTDDSFKYLQSFDNQINQETKEYIISPEERKDREDLTQKIVFTCDPVTARDLDDALSITKIEDDIYEIGVHIADVSHFVKEGTALDDDARLRTTSVYLVQKVIPMLPRLLCDDLCSLNPGVERLTFSVFFYAREDGTMVEDRTPRFVKSIIKTCAKLNYDIVQEIIEGKVTTAKELPLVYIPDGVDPEDVIKDALKMNQIAQNIRRRRFSQGSISFEREKKRFQLDEASYPISYKIDSRKESNWMVEEYMLLANQKVGKYIVDTCQEIGLLRCHPPPGNIKINFFELLLEKLHLTMNFESSKTIQESSAAIFNNPNVSEAYKSVVRFKMCKILEAAKYFVVEKTQAKEWRHFALNFDVYTHFTSPIRRYPDVLVHRLLEKCLTYQKDVKKYVNKYHMLAIMDKCNECKMNSKRVSDACEKLFMCLYMKKNPAFTKAIVLSVFSACIEIYIPMIETEKKIFWKDFKSHKSTKVLEDKDTKSLIVNFEVEKENLELRFKEFEYCEVYVNGTDSFPIEFKIHFVYENALGEKIIIT